MHYGLKLSFVLLSAPSAPPSSSSSATFALSSSLSVVIAVSVASTYAASLPGISFSVNDDVAVRVLESILHLVSVLNSSLTPVMHGHQPHFYRLPTISAAMSSSV